MKKAYVKIELLECHRVLSTIKKTVIDTKVERLSFFGCVRLLRKWWKFHFSEKNRIEALDGTMWYGIERHREIRFSWM